MRAFMSDRGERWHCASNRLDAMVTAECEVRRIVQEVEPRPEQVGHFRAVSLTTLRTGRHVPGLGASQLIESLEAFVSEARQ